MTHSRVMRAAAIGFVCAAALAFGAHSSAAQSSSLHGDIVAFDETSKGVLITMDLGTNAGVAVGSTGYIDGIKSSSFTIRTVTKRTSTALVSVSMDAVKTSSLAVVVSP
jgi:hypothetical protein